MFLALREIRHSKLRFVLITGVIVMVSCLVFILSGLANGLSAGNKQAIDAMPIDAMVISDGSDYLLDRSAVAAGDAKTIAGMDGIDRADPIGISSANIRKDGSTEILGVSFFGVMPDGMIQPHIDKGESWQHHDRGIVIDETLTEKGVGLGDTIVTEPGDVELEVVGITSGQSYRLAPTVFMSLDLWQQLQPTQEGAVPDAVSAILVRGDRDAIETIPATVDSTMIASKGQIISNIPGESEQNGTLLLIQVFLVVIAAGIIASFFYIMTLQKMPELGVMKAIGTKTSYLARNMIAQVLVLAVVGVLLGISIADTVALIIGNAVPYSISTQRMVIFGGLLLLVAIGGTVLSLFRIARVDPLDAINKA
ncbi:MAG TPA: ABC transporter permease, partial [Thermomicrobiales bacterium]|nr:ABC transporter permease [Thermomicrobiales bacterium]